MILKVPTSGIDFDNMTIQASSSTPNLPSDFFQILLLALMNLFQGKASDETKTLESSVNNSGEDMFGTQKPLKIENLEQGKDQTPILGLLLEPLAQNLNQEEAQPFPSEGETISSQTAQRIFFEGLNSPIEFPEKFLPNTESKIEVQEPYTNIMKDTSGFQVENSLRLPLQESAFHNNPEDASLRDEKLQDVSQTIPEISTKDQNRYRTDLCTRPRRIPEISTKDQNGLETPHNLWREKSVDTEPDLKWKTHSQETGSNPSLKLQETPKENDNQIYDIRNEISYGKKVESTIENKPESTLENKLGSTIENKDSRDLTEHQIFNPEEPKIIPGDKGVSVFSKEIHQSSTHVLHPQETIPPGEVKHIIKDFIYEIQPSGERRAKIKLEPPELGEMEIDLKVHKGEVQVVLTVEKPEAARELHLHLPHLRHSLEELGLNLSEFQIGFFGGGGGETSYTHQGTGEQKKRGPMRVEKLASSKEAPVTGAEKEGLLNIVV